MCKQTIVFERKNCPFNTVKQGSPYPRTCRACHHPIDPFELCPREKLIQDKLRHQTNCCTRYYTLWKHYIYTYCVGGRYVYELDKLDKAIGCDDSDRNLKFLKTLKVKKAVTKLKNLRGSGRKHSMESKDEVSFLYFTCNTYNITGIYMMIPVNR